MSLIVSGDLFVGPPDPNLVGPQDPNQFAYKTPAVQKESKAMLWIALASLAVGFLALRKR
jgi:hypothetical protein